MNHKAILLVTGGVMIGALTFGAIGASAQTPDISFSKGHGQGYGSAMSHNQGEYVTDVLGLTRDEVRAQVQDGKTMEEIATAQGYGNFESFKTAVENKIREGMTENGLSEDEINDRIERHQMRIEDRMEHMSEGLGEMHAHHRNANRDGSMARQHGMGNFDN